MRTKQGNDGGGAVVITACVCVGMAMVISLFRAKLFHSMSESDNPVKLTVLDSFIIKYILLLCALVFSSCRNSAP